MLLGTEIGLGPGDIVLDGGPAAPPLKKGHSSPHFSAHVYCGQTAGWIKMPLGTEVRLDPGDILLDGDPPPFQKRGHSNHPLFAPRLLWPNGWMDLDATWYRGIGLGPGEIALDGNRAPPTEIGTAAPTCRAMSILAKRSPISATAELFLNYSAGDFEVVLPARATRCNDGLKFGGRYYAKLHPIGAETENFTEFRHTNVSFLMTFSGLWEVFPWIYIWVFAQVISSYPGLNLGVGSPTPLAAKNVRRM